MKGAKWEIRDLERRMGFGCDGCVIQNVYIRTRFYQSVCWYLKKAVFYKHLFTVISIVNIILPAIVALLNSLFDANEICKIVVTVLSLVTGVLGSVLSFSKAHDKWLSYRTVAEQLQEELSLLIKGYGRTTQEENEKRFLERIEVIMAKEHEYWISMNADVKNQ